MPTVTLSTFTDFTQTGGGPPSWGSPSLVGSASISAAAGIAIIINSHLVNDGTIPLGSTIDDVVIRSTLNVFIQSTTALGGNSKITVGINNTFSSTPDVVAATTDASALTASGTFTRDMGAMTYGDLFSLTFGLRWSCGGGMGSPVDASGACTVYEVDVTYTAPVGPPTIESVTPDDGPISGNTDVVIMGTNFIDGADIFFGGVLATNIMFISSIQYNCTTPPHGVGPVDVLIVLPGSDGTTP